MSKSIHLSLRADERLFINGAVIKADRRVSIELLNDATYLHESQVLQHKDTTTPLRQLYFVVQTMVMDPRHLEAARQLFEISYTSLMLAFANKQILAALVAVRGLIEKGNVIEALATLRGLFAMEDQILGNAPAAPVRLLEAV
jgi:flagellar protein FlbT